jgi:hypothetical protein
VVLVGHNTDVICNVTLDIHQLVIRAAVILLMVDIEVMIVLLLYVIMDIHYMVEFVVETNPLILIGHGMDAIGIVRHHQHFI